MLLFIGVKELFIRSLVVGEEKMTSGHWLGLVLYVSFGVLTLMAG